MSEVDNAFREWTRSVDRALRDGGLVPVGGGYTICYRPFGTKRQRRLCQRSGHRWSPLCAAYSVYPADPTAIVRHFEQRQCARCKRHEMRDMPT